MLYGSNTSLVAETLLLASTPSLPNLLFLRIARGICRVTSGGSEKEEIEEEEEEEDMFDKEAELGLVMSKDFCVSEEEFATRDEGVSDFGGVPTRTEGADNCVCGKGEKVGVVNVEEAVMF
ncbi:uncharacterized protein MONOS_2394 [Monocercomonoides exilis]|uniref:uncharacterized protein n=1 Tax=Monocercomonoides exilis TaxID=2049356 RepID=UPI0035597214|nr:hypothetical protein MONOS_2394 [Monocercomonoides exilis]|eukprot:MONOS_2394.1-p1 / transcript=MONOS_2394.1 / gene=MONOS_2394 / organism=Monocercomonoides_exilis_PA203 / gene_product=unspecified product / transcript_product=unspecified product / location=Mono_scaffold00049:66606-66968(-) / protein_length=121 / sequence_SO=supercontig / SO=protein_coding / is_pseudo=false